MMEWIVGQEVYIVPFDKRRDKPQAAKIVKIARKWMELEPSYLGPISKEDGHVKPERGYSSTAKAWPSKEAYEENVKLNNKWDELRALIGYSRPKHLSGFDLDLIIGLVGEDD